MQIAKLKKMLKSRAGLSTGMVNTAIMAIILVVVLFQLYATLVPTAQDAGQDLNDSGVPLGTLFLPSGIVFVIIMAALLIVVVRSFLKKK